MPPVSDNTQLNSLSTIIVKDVFLIYIHRMYTGCNAQYNFHLCSFSSSDATQFNSLYTTHNDSVNVYINVYRGCNILPMESDTFGVTLNNFYTHYIFIFHLIYFHKYHEFKSDVLINFIQCVQRSIKLFLTIFR